MKLTDRRKFEIAKSLMENNSLREITLAFLVKRKIKTIKYKFDEATKEAVVTDDCVLGKNSFIIVNKAVEVQFKEKEKK